jgi:IS30 family transposase
MKYYYQLTMVQRYQIEALIKEGVSKSCIAKSMSVHRSTIYREIKRNSIDGEYKAEYAQIATRLRYQKKKKNLRFTKEHKKYILTHLKEGWSPEQISGRMELDGLSRLSHETIYRFIYKEIRKGKKLGEYLRHKNRKYKSRKGIYEYRGKISRAKPICQRPAAVENKERIGDFEADTIIGKNHKEAIVTLVDRHSKFTLMQKVVSKEAFDVSRAILKLLKPLQGIVKTITSDNGKEFAYHQEIERKLNAFFYFAEPYKSWQRGLNEHTNGLIREYIPKKTDFSNVSNRDIVTIQDRLNHRPRKVLGYKTPYEVFFGKIAEWIDDSKLHYKNQIVAVDC